MRIDWRAPVVLGLTLVLAGCGGEDGDASTSVQAASDEVLVAKVGTRPVTKSYFEERLEKMERKFLPDTLDIKGKTEFLQFIINKEVMAMKAEELEYDKDPQIDETLSSYEVTLMRRHAIETLTEGKIDVTPEEVEEFYNRKQQEVLVKHILLPTRAVAEEIRARLMDGAPFDSLVERHSLVPKVDQNGDELPTGQRATFGWIEYGKSQPWVEKAVFETPVNEITQPLQTSYGWHLFMPTSRRDKRLNPLNDLSEVIERQISLRKRRQIVEAYYEDVLQQHGFQLNEAVLDLAFTKIPEDIDPREAPSPETEVKPLLPFTSHEREMTVFELDGKKYTLGDLSDRYDESNFFERPKRYSGARGLRFWIRDKWLQHLQDERARQDRIDQLPEVKHELAFRREQMMVSSLHNNLISGQVPEPTEEQIQAFYDEHTDTYIDKEKRICNLIFHPRERIVRRAYKEIEGGSNFVETAIRYNDNATEPQHVQTIAFTRDDPDFAEIAKIAWGLKRHQYSEPFKSSEGWLLLQVEHITREKPFELEQIREFVTRDWKNDWSEKQLNAMLDDWKQGVEIEIYEDVLAKAEVRRDDVFVPGRPKAKKAEPEASGTQ